MNTHAQLKLILSEGESSQVEFKEGKKHLGREIVAFANASGGSIFLGVDDHGKIVGIEVSSRLKSEIMDVARNCDPSIKVELIPYRDDKVLEIKVSESSTKPHSTRDGFFLRIGPSTQKLKQDEIIALAHQSGNIYFDEAINTDFEYPKDFSEQALTRFLQACGIETQRSHKEILLSLNVAKEEGKKLLFTNTGVLFFAKSPQTFHPEAYVTAVRYKTQDRLSIIDKKDFTGSPIEQIESTMAFLAGHIAVASDITSTLHSLAARKDIYDYPLVALREAVVNAVTHRDYFYDRSHIYLHMYPDRIDLENPGGLCHGLSIDKLGTRSVRRNRLIADLLHRARYIERVGSGFDRMQQALDDNQNPHLEVDATNFFHIRFYKRIGETSGTTITSRGIRLLSALEERESITTLEAATLLDVSPDTARRELKTLIQAGIIFQHGTGKATVYKRAI